jgi:ABC-type proline/glycine betaine transport system permease subunit
VVSPETGSLTLAYFTKFLERKYYWSTLVNSFAVTIVSTFVAALIGLPMAYVLRSIKVPGSKYLNILIVISYLSPPFIGAYAWIQLLGRNGFFTKLFNGLLGTHFDGIYGFAGIVLVFSLQSFPLIYMYVSGALKNLDNSLNEAAESLGCTAFQRVQADYPAPGDAVPVGRVPAGFHAGVLRLWYAYAYWRRFSYFPGFDLHPVHGRGQHGRSFCGVPLRHRHRHHPALVLHAALFG